MKLEPGAMRNEPTEIQLMTSPITARKRATYLSVVDMLSLDHQCLMLREVGFSVYLVGSCLTLPDYRDVDLRAIVDDKEFGALIEAAARRDSPCSTPPSPSGSRTAPGRRSISSSSVRPRPMLNTNGERNALGLRAQE
jgi:hypothetical protein